MHPIWTAQPLLPAAATRSRWCPGNPEDEQPGTVDAMTTVERDDARPTRREELLLGALALFREKGYHATGINDIGAAVGVSGPAIYRHFASKDELLAEAIMAGARQIAAATRDALAEDRVPGEALEELARAYVGLAIANRDMMAVYLLEARHLPTDQRRPIGRSVRRFRQAWSDLLLRARPELDERQADSLVRHVMFMAIANSVETYADDDDQTVALVTAMVLAALYADV